MIVYKYLHPRNLTVLEEGLIRFSQSAVLNDPFETTPNMERLKESFLAHAMRMIDCATYRSLVDYVAAQYKARAMVKRHLDEFQKDKTRKYAVLSLSRTNNNLLMWAHYCDSHRGLVIGFDSTHEFFQTRRFNAFSVLAEVHYSDHRPVMPAPDRWDGSQEQLVRVIGSEDLAELFFYTKSSDWAYEQEMRMIANPKVADRVIAGADGENIYLYRFPPECVREVIFGIRMDGAERDRIANVVSERYNQAELFQAKLNSERFNLDIVRIR